MGGEEEMIEFKPSISCLNTCALAVVHAFSRGKKFEGKEEKEEGNRGWVGGERRKEKGGKRKGRRKKRS